MAIWHEQREEHKEGKKYIAMFTRFNFKAKGHFNMNIRRE